MQKKVSVWSACKPWQVVALVAICGLTVGVLTLVGQKYVLIPSRKLEWSRKLRGHMAGTCLLSWFAHVFRKIC
jgi:hypothetical protein